MRKRQELRSASSLTEMNSANGTPKISGQSYGIFTMGKSTTGNTSAYSRLAIGQNSMFGNTLEWKTLPCPPCIMHTNAEFSNGMASFYLNHLLSLYVKERKFARKSYASEQWEMPQLQVPTDRMPIQLIRLFRK